MQRQPLMSSGQIWALGLPRSAVRNTWCQRDSNPLNAAKLCPLPLRLLCPHPGPAPSPPTWAAEQASWGTSPHILVFPPVILLKINQIVSHTPFITFLKAFLSFGNEPPVPYRQALCGGSPPALLDLSPAILLSCLSAHPLDPGAPSAVLSQCLCHCCPLCLELRSPRSSSS